MQRELEKLTYNQKLVELEIERAKVAKARAQLEKDKITFLNEQAEFVRTGKSPYYGHLTTIARLEEAKHNVEVQYRHELEELKTKQDEALKTAVGSEIARVKEHYDERFYKLSRFYELFKEKYKKLKDVNGKMLFDLNAKMQETYGLQLQINQLNSIIQEREGLLQKANAEIAAKAKVIDDFREQQPEVIEDVISTEVTARMREQTEKLNAALLIKEKTLLEEVEKRRAEVDKTLAVKAAEVERLVIAVSELEKALQAGTEELSRVRDDYDFAARSNRELTEAIKVLRADNERLVKDLEEALAEKADAQKLNGLLVRKYRDGEERAQIEKTIDADAQKIIRGQEVLSRLLRRRIAAEEQRQYRKIKNQIEGVVSPVPSPSIANSTPTKRKRGRPRKEDAPTPTPVVLPLVAAPAVLSNPTKRKRGRPRKVVNTEVGLPVPVTETAVRNAVFVPETKDGSPIKRKRGRPRKYPLPPTVETTPLVGEKHDEPESEVKRLRTFNKLVDIE